MDDVTQVPAAELAVLPALEGLGDGHESSTQFFLVRLFGMLTQEALYPLGRVCHTLSLSVGAKRPSERATPAREASVFSALLGPVDDERDDIEHRCQKDAAKRNVKPVAFA